MSQIDRGAQAEEVVGTGNLPPLPRGMSRRDAALYVGCQSVSSFNRLRRKGIMPGPIPGTRLWDRKALDAAMDRLSGLTQRTSEADAWFAGYGHARAA